MMLSNSLIADRVLPADLPPPPDPEIVFPGDGTDSTNWSDAFDNGVQAVEDGDTVHFSTPAEEWLIGDNSNPSPPLATGNIRLQIGILGFGGDPISVYLADIDSLSRLTLPSDPEPSISVSGAGTFVLDYGGINLGEWGGVQFIPLIEGPGASQFSIVSYSITNF